MSVAFAEPVLDRPIADEPAGGTGPARVRTRTRRPGPGVGPTARPRRLRFSTPAVAGALPGPRACQAAPAARRPQAWHLTDRGMALVLVVAAALVAASIAVVGLTAFRVTGESYRPSHSQAGPSVAASVLVEP